MTETEKAEYLGNNGTMCPCCGLFVAKTLKGRLYDSIVYLERNCIGCGSNWEDVYRLVDIVNVVDNSPLTKELSLKMWLCSETTKILSKICSCEVLIYAPTEKDALDKWKKEVGIEGEDSNEYSDGEQVISLCIVKEVTKEEALVLEKYIACFK